MAGRAVLQNDIYYKNLSQLVKKLDIECRFTEAFDYEAVLELVEAGKCDAGLVNYLYGHQYDRKYNINRSSIILSPQKIHFAVPKGKNRQLINTVDMYLRNLKKDKSSIYYQSLSRWIGVDFKQMDLIWIYAAGAGAAGIILLVLILNLILRSQVSKRTQELDAKNQALIYEIERRKNVEAALQKNEREYRSVFENTGTATFIVEEDMTISKVNEKAAKMIGYPKLEIEGKMKTSDFISRKDLKRLTISDNGIGIAPDEINRIFEPFYTKKKMGRSGTGLGMAVVWGTVKDHKGYLHVKSDEGKGTTIKLFFPVTRKPVRRNEIANSFESYRGEGESILVVDDVKEQREIASKLLAYLGYSVQTVSSGKEAIEHIDAKPTDLVVLDMLMPAGIDGLETYERIISKHPGQKAIIASGFSETNRVKKAQGLGAGSYVKKPYTLEKIGLAVKAELKELSSAA